MSKVYYRCSSCDLEVKFIPKFKEGECPKDIQHYFKEIEDGN